MTQRSTRSIEEIDPNFKASIDSTNLFRWVDAFDRESLALRGLAWLEENYAARHFRRLPDRAAGALSDALQILSHHPASAFLAFATDSPRLSVRVKVSEPQCMMHMPLTGSNSVELYVKEGPQWLPVATAVPTPNEVFAENVLLKDLPPTRREFRLYLPLYRKLEELQLGFAPEATVQPLPAREGEKPIFVYGTSVTQGGCASTAGSDFLSLTGRLLDRELINFGFSGNGRGEAEVARLVSEVDATMFVLNFTSNCPVEYLEERLPRFIEILREAHPVTPIVLIPPPCYDVLLIRKEHYNMTMFRRDVAMETYLDKKRKGDQHLHLIDGFGLTPIGQTGTYVDGLHPTSSGFFEMGKRLAAQLEAILIWERHWGAQA